MGLCKRLATAPATHWSRHRQRATAQALHQAPWPRCAGHGCRPCGPPARRHTGGAGWEWWMSADCQPPWPSRRSAREVKGRVRWAVQKCSGNIACSRFERGQDRVGVGGKEALKGAHGASPCPEPVVAVPTTRCQSPDTTKQHECQPPATRLECIESIRRKHARGDHVCLPVAGASSPAQSCDQGERAALDPSSTCPGHVWAGT